MTLGTIFSRRKAVAACLAVALLVLGFVPWRVGPGPWRDATVNRLANALGAEEMTLRSIRFAVLPVPRLELQNISLVQNGGMLRATIPSARVNLRLAPLLRGVAKAANIMLSGPDINLAVAASEERGFRQFAQIASHGGLLSLPSSLHWLSKLSVDQGRVTVRYGSSEAVDLYEDLRLRLSLAAIGKPLSIAMTARRNGEDLQANFRGAATDDVRDGRIAPVAFSYWTPGLSVEFDGKGSFSGKTAFVGSLLARAGAKAPPPFMPALTGLGIDSLPPMELAAQLDFSDRGANLSDLHVLFDRDRFDGAGAVRHDGQRWHVSGTLAAGQADLSRLFSALSRIRSVNGDWNTHALDTDALFATNIDLRISADQLTVHGQQFKRAALALMARANRIEATLADATYEGGQARLRLVLSPGADGLDLRATGSVDQIDLAAMIGNFTKTQRFKGNGSANLTLESSGKSVAQFVANAEGRLSAALRDGALIGIDLNHLANRRAARPELLLIDALGGRTPFESATLTTRISRGLAAPVDGYLQGGRIVGSLTGQVDFAQGLTNLSGSVVQVPAEAFVVEPIPVLDFNITGPLSEPRITPNITSLLKRS